MRAAWAMAALLATGSAGAQAELQRLVQELGNAEHSISVAAYQELSRRRDPAVVPLIAKEIAGWQRNAQQYSIYLLRAQPIEVTRAVWKKLLDADSSFLAVAAASSLAHHQERGAGKQLATVLRKVPEAERAGVVYLTYDAENRDDEVFAELLSWLTPTANATTVMITLNRLRQFATATDAAQTASLRTTSLRAAVEPLAKATDTGVRAAALAYLAGFDATCGEALAALLVTEPDRLPPIRGLLDGERKLSPALVEAIAATLPNAKSEHDVRQTADLLRKQSPGAGQGELRQLLKHQQPEIRAAALTALALNAGGLDDKVLQELLHGDDLAAALVAADVLRRRDDLTGLEVVLAAVPRAGQHRAKLAAVLASFRDRRVVPPLLDLLDDGDMGVRREAWSGLQELLRGLFPYRRFDFASSGYAPEAGSRSSGIAVVRAWWDAEAKAR